MSLYIRRLVAMLLIALPVTTVVLALAGIVQRSTSDAGDAFGGALVLVYVWGAITASLVSVAHTLLTQREFGSRNASIAVGVVLGLVGGALTPTAFTGFFLPTAILLGGLTGLVYGLVVEQVPFKSAGQRAA